MLPFPSSADAKFCWGRISLKFVHDLLFEIENVSMQKSLEVPPQSSHVPYDENST